MSVETEQSHALSKLAAYLRRQGEQCNAQQPLVYVAGSELLKAADALEAKLDEKDVVMGGKDERIAKLEEALEPFADALGDDDEDEADHLQGTLVIGRSTIYCLDLGDFRRARAALNPRTQDD